DPNLNAVPLFTNAGTGDLSEAPGSPTIDAGLDDPLNGPTDFAGNARQQGGATDIGAFEFPVAPPAPPSQASTTPTAIPPKVCKRSLASEAKKKKRKRGCTKKNKRKKRV